MTSTVSGRRGLMFVVSAPSGTGKTTVVERLVQVAPGLSLSRSYTSRSVRPGETDGIDYNFITRTRFEDMVATDAFLEWADVFGNLYGTCAEDAERELSAGRDLVLVIDVQGARQVRARCPGTVGVFVLPPTYAVLERRKATDPWQISFRVVAYDWDAAGKRAADKGREDWARWIWTGYAS